MKFPRNLLKLLPCLQSWTLQFRTLQRQALVRAFLATFFCQTFCLQTLYVAGHIIDVGYIYYVSKFQHQTRSRSKIYSQKLMSNNVLAVPSISTSVKLGSLFLTECSTQEHQIKKIVRIFGIQSGCLEHVLIC